MVEYLQLENLQTMKLLICGKNGIYRGKLESKIGFENVLNYAGYCGVIPCEEPNDPTCCEVELNIQSDCDLNEKVTLGFNIKMFGTS